MSTSCIITKNDIEGTTTVKKRQLTEEEKHKILVDKYDQLPETSPLQTTLRGIITATKDFVYLGSLVHFSLQDRYGMDKRIQKAGKLWEL